MPAIYSPPPNPIRAIVAAYGVNHSGLKLSYHVYNGANISVATGNLSEIGTTGIYTAYPSIAPPFSGVVVCDAPKGISPVVVSLI